MTETNPPADDLLRRAESYLSALHGSVARHDNLAAGFGCAGCELRDQIAAALRAAATVPASAPTDWIDGHPQLEAIATAVWERCGRSDSGTCVEDDPRNIAVAALAAVLPLPADQAAEISQLRAKVFEWQGSYLAEVKVRQERDAQVARLRADRAAILREAADALGRMDYDTDSHDYGYDTYRDAWNGGVMDAADLLRRLAAVSGPHDTDDTTGQAECTASISGSCLREAESETACDTETGECVHGGRPGGEAQQPETQAEVECANCWRLVENRGTPNMGGPPHDNWVHVPGGFQSCFPQRGADSPRAEPRPAVVSQPVEPEATVAYQSTGGQLLRCLAHKPGRLSLELGCFHPVASEDLPDGGLCTFQVSDTAVCGRDVLIAVDETEA
ncbi:hypothetical protein [Streptomyces sp. NPDC060188]|uniref:hypothetical protein n=1 Tax=Streptomyces sp. NPDC060188 TaxID=3347068 RepID=UPI003666D2B2